MVAFVNLDKDKQVELFMEINENQKAVSKNLQNTLNAVCCGRLRIKISKGRHFRLNIAQRLGEFIIISIFNRVIIGENETSAYCCLTIDTIGKCVKINTFLTRFGKDNHEIEAGTFDRGSNDVTRGVLLPFLMEAFQYFKNELPEEWELGDANSGVLTINNTIHALLRILNDIIDFLIERDKINP